MPVSADWGMKQALNGRGSAGSTYHLIFMEPYHQQGVIGARFSETFFILVLIIEQPKHRILAFRGYEFLKLAKSWPDCIFAVQSMPPRICAGQKKEAVTIYRSVNS